MTRGTVFWVIMIVWFVFALLIHFAPGTFGAWGGAASDLLFFVLFALIGWQVFGAPIHG